MAAPTAAEPAPDPSEAAAERAAKKARVDADADEKAAAVAKVARPVKAPVAPVAQKPKPGGDLPWAERHRPRHLGQVVGNTDQVRKLAEWLRDWDDVVLRGKKKEPPKQESWRTYAPKEENLNARAALVSGPPGIGKTTTCCLVARCSQRYKVMEFNASDARTKKVIDSMNQSLAGNRTLNLGPGGRGALERALIVMDECDGMSGGGDSGGMTALINMIKVTKNPIICICNDRSDKGVRDLANHCYDLRFRRPENAAVAKRIKAILEGEGRQANVHTIEAIVEGCGHDLRQIINQVQFFGSVSASGRGSAKDTQLMMSPFDACTKLLSGGERGAKSLSMHEKQNLFEADADIVPLMVQENYLRAAEGRRYTRRRQEGSLPEEDALDRAAKAAGLIATADTMGANWSLVGDAGIIGTLYPAFLAAPDEPFMKPSFPAWLTNGGPRQRRAKAEKCLQDMHAKLKGHTSCSLRDLAPSNYHDLLYRKLVKPLQLGGVKECAAGLVAYGLTREFFTEQAPALRQPLQMEDFYTKVEGSAKTKLGQEIKDLTQQQAPKRKTVEGGGSAFSRRRTAGAGRDADADGEDGGEGDAAEGVDDKKKKAAAKGGKGKGKGAGRGGKSNSASSLGSWKKTPYVGSDPSGDNAGSGEGSSSGKQATLVLKYIEGHTNAVRRKMYLKDFTGPWMGF